MSKRHIALLTKVKLRLKTTLIFNAKVGQIQTLQNTNLFSFASLLYLIINLRAVMDAWSQYLIWINVILTPPTLSISSLVHFLLWEAAKRLFTINTVNLAQSKMVVSASRMCWNTEDYYFSGFFQGFNCWYCLWKAPGSLMVLLHIRKYKLTPSSPGFILLTSSSLFLWRSPWWFPPPLLFVWLPESSPPEPS